VTQITTVMVVILLAVCTDPAEAGIPVVRVPPADSLKFSADALALLKAHRPGAHSPQVAFLGILIAFGHSVLSMSVRHRWPQSSRAGPAQAEEPESAQPSSAVYSFVFTGLTSLLFVMIIPDSVSGSRFIKPSSRPAMYQYGGPCFAATGFPASCGGGLSGGGLIRPRGQYRHHRSNVVAQLAICGGWCSHRLVPAPHPASAPPTG